MGESFDIGALFDEDYLYFYEGRHSDEATAAELEVLWAVAPLEPGQHALDLACGHGRIANRLAERGVAVTGLDATPRFLELAREDARRRGVTVHYVQGDMRALPWRHQFDLVITPASPPWRDSDRMACRSPRTRAG